MCVGILLQASWLSNSTSPSQNLLASCHRTSANFEDCSITPIHFSRSRQAFFLFKYKQFLTILIFYRELNKLGKDKDVGKIKKDKKKKKKKHKRKEEDSEGKCWTKDQKNGSNIQTI